MINPLSIFYRRRLKICLWVASLVFTVIIVDFIDKLWQEESRTVERCVGPCQVVVLTHDRRPVFEKAQAVAVMSSPETISAMDRGELENVCDKRPTANMNLLGHLNVHTWRGWCGFTVDDLRRDPRFPLRPNVKSSITDFVVNVSRSEYLGRRIFGYLHPPITGVYTFAISSTDSSELWLSSDESPKNSQLIAYLGEAGFQYGASAPFKEFTVKESQTSKNISLTGGTPYYIEALQKQKHNEEHIEVAWITPDSRRLQVISTEYLSPFVDYSASNQDISAREECVMKQHRPLELRYTKLLTQEQEDRRDDIPFKVKTLDHSDVADILPSCAYKPSYVVNRKMGTNEAIVGGFIKPTLVYPDDHTDIYASNDENDVNRGNDKIDENEAEDLVSVYMTALSKMKGNLYSLKQIVNVEAKVDTEKGTRYLLELELNVEGQEASVRLSEYVYRRKDNDSTLCYPEGFQWRRDVVVTMVVTVKNYGHWIKFLVNQLENIYTSGKDKNFHLIIVDFNSTDLNMNMLKTDSIIHDRITILKKSSEFYKTMGLNEAVSLVKDIHSIVFTTDLHIQFPGNIFDAIRKHTIEGRSTYVPLVLKIKCGHTVKHQQGGWDGYGYGLFGAYKSDWDRFGGMNTKDFKTKWGGEDWDIMDRAVGTELEAERIRQPKLYHFYHDRKGDWYEFARI